MASTAELLQLNREGDLGKLIVWTFKGECGRLYPRKDSDLMIGFRTKDATPEISLIERLVTRHYEELGYTVEAVCGQASESFEFLIYFNEKSNGCIFVIISTFYPLVMGDDHNHVRITTTVNA